MTQEMYGASGKVGNKVYYRSNGKTVAREAVTPKNPKTNAQTIQRVIASQVTKTYQKFKAICDHSFEGYSMGAQCANQFKKLNMRKLRSRASEINQAGQSLAQFYNFQPVGATGWVPGSVILSQGQLPRVATEMVQSELGLYCGRVAIAENTYAGVINSLGLKRGDQLTFITVSKVNDEYVPSYARVILDPRSGDGSAPLSTAFVDSEGVIQNPSWKNKGSIYLDFDTDHLDFIANPVNGAVCVASAIIVSRKDGDEWLRSNSVLVISEAAIGSDLTSLWDAVEQSYQASEIDLENEQYLNNAGTGGAEGSSSSTTPVTPPSSAPTFNNTVSFNGAGQNVAGGSVNVTAPLNTVVVSGTNLSEAGIYAVKGGSTEHIVPTKTATAATFSSLNGAANDTFTFYKAEGGAAWFTVTVLSGGGGGGGNLDD